MTITVNMKLMVFAGYHYYPYGGWEDFQGYFDTLEEAKKYIENIKDVMDFNWAHIVENGEKIVCTYYKEWPEKSWIISE